MKKNIKLFLVLIWMIFIFYMSSLNSNISSNQSGYIVSFIARIFNISNNNTISFIVRKLAHIFEYFILYILICNYLKECKNKNYMLFSIILSIVYSLTDELHQLFIPGRSGRPEDILIDLIGITLGYITYNLYLKVNKN